MTLTSAIKLSTRRPIVNHPHYEDTGASVCIVLSFVTDKHAGIRNRTFHLYQIFSRKSDTELHAIFHSMRVDYVILDWTWCREDNKPFVPLPLISTITDSRCSQCRLQHAGAV